MSHERLPESLDLCSLYLAYTVQAIGSFEFGLFAIHGFVGPLLEARIK